tara:strand:- start:4650 stop:5033 length:384 start_codon:yes stop_codon:yes gene_type:complete
MLGLLIKGGVRAAKSYKKLKKAQKKRSAKTAKKNAKARPKQDYKKYIQNTPERKAAYKKAHAIKDDNERLNALRRLNNGTKQYRANAKRDNIISGTALAGTTAIAANEINKQNKKIDEKYKKKKKDK